MAETIDLRDTKDEPMSDDALARILADARIRAIVKEGGSGHSTP